ncbi:HAD family phosphatase [uncultured Gemmiger sp.]|uniref:HAD family hydrolase n=1 Tax=uncultured Gemmiger sp. TaxID=1623490 RepID=UPI0025F70827|nr:HAD family phosphatase [uncultured Gemmiger sp.]
MQLLPYAILDMDGTLLDSSGMWDDVARGLLAQWNAVYTQGQGDDTMTMTIDGAAAYFVEQCHLPVTPRELAQQIRDRARQAYGTIAKLKPGVREAIDLMKSRGMTLCVASGTEKPLVDAALEQFGLLDRFAFTVSCRTPQGKAEPEVYLRAAQKLGADPEQIMVFEDSPVAVHTARKAGFYTIGVLDEHTRPHWEEVRRDADAVLTDWPAWCAEMQG